MSEVFLDLISYLRLNLVLNLCYILGTYFHKKVLASILHPLTLLMFLARFSFPY